MSLTTYAELKTSVISWSHRNDLDLLIDDFIALAEAEMFKGKSHECLQLRDMETTSTASLNAIELALPDNFQSMRSFRITGDSITDLQYKTPQDLYVRTGTGRPAYYTITSQLEFDVAPDETYTAEMVYLKKPTGLSSSNTTNAVLTNHPDIYLFGALWALFVHAVDDMQAQKYYMLFINAIDGANHENEEGQYAVAPYARIQGATP